MSVLADNFDQLNVWRSKPINLYSFYSRAECKEKGVTGVFSALDGVISAGLATASVKSDQNITIITINDDLWKQHIPYGMKKTFFRIIEKMCHFIFSAEDPISKEPVFQRQVVGTQIVEGVEDIMIFSTHKNASWLVEN